ncbi:MAG: restriction endonuclease subunit S, partial [Sphingobacteriales bacterium]
MSKRYPSYKSSGVEWIGEIPAHWELRKLSRSFERIGSGTTPSVDNRSYYEGGTINWVNTGDLNDTFLTDTARRVTDIALHEHSALRIFPAGSVVMAMYGATIGKLSMLGIPACTNQACCVLTRSDYFDNKYLFYWLATNRQHIISMAYGGGQPNISQELVKSHAHLQEIKAFKY